MYWQESDNDNAHGVPDDVGDLGFRIECPRLPVDHAQSLLHGLLACLPWLEREQLAGVHGVRGAASGNGWLRPEDGAAELLLPRRARLYLRLSKTRIDDALQLSGQTLDIAGYRMRIGAGSVRALTALPTLSARCVVEGGQSSESGFVEQAAEQLRRLGIAVRKLLCGMPHTIATESGPLLTRSLMVADLDAADSVRLQQHGIGPGRTLGCGLFVPHKGIAAVLSETAQEKKQ